MDHLKEKDERVVSDPIE
jgi:hypothetical protein